MAKFTPAEYVGEAIPYNDGVARAGGDIIVLGDGRTAVVAGVNAVAASDEYGVYTKAKGTVACASDVEASAGDKAYWDTSANTLKEEDAQAGAPANCIYAGLFGEDKAAGETVATLNLGWEHKRRTIVSTYASGTWAVRTGFTTLKSYRVTIRRAGVQLSTNPTLSVSGGVLTIASTASGYTVTADDVATIEVTGV